MNVIEKHTAKMSIHNGITTILLRVTEKVYKILERDFVSNKIEICAYIALWQCLLHVFVYENEFSRFTLCLDIFFNTHYSYAIL